MLTKEGISSLRERLAVIRADGAKYFERVTLLPVDQGYAGHSWEVAEEDQAKAEEGCGPTLVEIALTA